MSQQYPPNPPFENNVVGNSPLNPNYQPDEFVAPFSNYPPPKRKRHVLRNILIAIGGLFMLLIVAAVLSPGSPEAKAPVAVTTQAVETPVPSTPPSAATQPSPKVTHKPAPTTKPKLTGSQEQAVGTAEDYLDTSAFSKSGLIDQLVYEGFSQADAKYAVAHITVNWNEQAALSAKEYLDVSHFSRSGLIGQLEYEGFTHSQAVYGVTKAGL